MSTIAIFSLQYSSFPLMTISLIFLSFSFLILLLKFSSPTRKPHRPPSPPTFPVIGNLHQLGLHPHRSLQKLSLKYGPIMLLHLGKSPTLIISSADTACEITKTHDLVFSDRPITKIRQILLYGQKGVAIAPYGEHWRQMKSICVLNLLSNKRVQSYRDIRQQETEIMIERIEKMSSFSEGIDLSEIFAELTSGIIGRAALGKKYGGTERGRSFKELLMEYTELLGGFDVGDCIPWLGWVSGVRGLYGRAEELAKEMDGFLSRVVDEHIGSGNWKGNEGIAKAFVDVLVWIQKEGLAGFPVDTTSIKAIILMKLQSKWIL